MFLIYIRPLLLLIMLIKNSISTTVESFINQIKIEILCWMLTNNINELLNSFKKLKILWYMEKTKI